MISRNFIASIGYSMVSSEEIKFKFCMRFIKLLFAFLYRNLILIPKAGSQLAKTVLSIPTHIRNLMSAGGFAGANGVLLSNPKDLANAFKEGAQISGLFNLKNFRQADLEKAYREMLELGIVNQQVQIGDMKNIFK